MTLHPHDSTLLHAPDTQLGGLRVATYNIHKGVRGIGPRKRLEIHNLGLAVEALDADLDLDNPAVLREVMDKGIAATRQLAKRQITWLRSMRQRHVVPCDAGDPLSAIRQHLTPASLRSVS